uniref:Uncharacterized protein n=1 Tax=Rhizophora mucronata TaxID=61149 RepID=A0A2P2LQ12_RHIMU
MFNWKNKHIGKHNSVSSHSSLKNLHIFRDEGIAAREAHLDHTHDLKKHLCAHKAVCQCPIF